jgi:hypothetical protein
MVLLPVVDMFLRQGITVIVDDRSINGPFLGAGEIFFFNEQRKFPVFGIVLGARIGSLSKIWVSGRAPVH